MLQTTYTSNIHCWLEGTTAGFVLFNCEFDTIFSLPCCLECLMRILLICWYFSKGMKKYVRMLKLRGLTCRLKHIKRWHFDELLYPNKFQCIIIVQFQFNNMLDIFSYEMKKMPYFSKVKVKKYTLQEKFLIYSSPQIFEHTVILLTRSLLEDISSYTSKFEVFHFILNT